MVRYFSLCVLLVCTIFGNAQVSDTLLLQNQLSVFFDSDSSSLDAASIHNIDSFLTIKKQDTLLKIGIEAHTDSVGSIIYNQSLSEKRAARVLNHIRGLNISFEKIESQSLGELKPKSPNKTKEGRQINRRVDLSIYRSIKWAWVNGQLVDDISGNPISGTILLRSKELRDSTNTDSLGHFKVKAPIGEVVVVEADAPGHFFIDKIVKITPQQLKNSLVINMPQASIGRKFEVENLYFVGNQPTLLPNSIPVINRLLDFMQTNRDLCIRIDGHINLPNQAPVEKSTWHYELSDNRTKTVFNFLIDNGIDDRRMQRKAFGNWEMVYPKATVEEKMRKNRRVEIFIIDCN